MNKPKMPLEAMDVIYKERIKEMENLFNEGRMTSDEFAVFASESAVYHHEHFLDASRQCMEFGKELIDERKKHYRELRILRQFLLNNNLLGDYSVYKNRILEKIMGLK